MKMDHIALVTDDIEKLKDFYVKNFGGVAEEKWTDGTVELYFVEFDNGVQIELEKRANPARHEIDRENSFGIAHLAFQVESKKILQEVTDTLIERGVKLRSTPTAYGYDFYESRFFDPDGNVVEISVNRENLKNGL